MFIGRQWELQELNKYWGSDKFEFPVVYGRRRVGKTTLLVEFTKDKKAIYFTAVEASNKINLRNFSEQVFSVLNPGETHKRDFENWEEAFDYIGQHCQKERLILIIDEYPYLAKSFKPLSSILQRYIDHNFKDSKLFLILCGSSMSFMEKQVLGYKSPLYGRRTCQFKMLPFNFFQSLPFLEKFKNEDKVTLYSIVGGIPAYLSKINPEMSVQDNIKELFLTPSGFLFEEPTNLIKQELKEPSTYNGIIEAVADGATKLHKIATKNYGMDSGKCAKYIKFLIELYIMQKEIPATKTKSKKSLYRISDNLFKFWYKFIFKNISVIVDAPKMDFWGIYIKPYLENYVGLSFEDVCKQYLYKLLEDSKLPIAFSGIGRWWGNDLRKKEEAEIDLVAYKGNETAICCECKWRNEKTGFETVEKLIYRSQLLNFKTTYYYVFSKSGFTKNCIEKAKKIDNLKLIKFNEMF